MDDKDSAFWKFFDRNLSVMLLINPGSRQVFQANPAATRFYGYSAEQLSGMALDQINILPQDQLAHEVAAATREERNFYNFTHRLANGDTRDVEVYSTPVALEGQTLLCSIVHDVSERRRVEAELATMQHNFVTLLESTSDFVYFKDQDSRFRYCSQNMARITGYKSWRDLVGKHSLEVFPSDVGSIYHQEDLPIFESGQPLLNKVNPYIQQDGSMGWIETNKWPMFGPDGHTVVGIFGISRDVTERRRLESELRVMATTDFLTGVATRRSVLTDLERELARIQRDPHISSALLMFDLDHFKQVNDEHGHAGGDAVLQHVTRLAGAEIRRVDHIGRLGGEEFVILMPDASLNAAQIFAERLRQRVASASLLLNASTIHVTISIGLTTLVKSDSKPDLPLQRADQALYRAKAGGRNRVEFTLAPAT